MLLIDYVTNLIKVHIEDCLQPELCFSVNGCYFIVQLTDNGNYSLSNWYDKPITCSSREEVAEKIVYTLKAIEAQVIGTDISIAID